MLEGLGERSPGRPRKQPDPETEELRRRVQELEKELERGDQSEELRRLLRDATEKRNESREMIVEHIERLHPRNQRAHTETAFSVC